MVEKCEDRIASETEAGREALRVWREVVHRMAGEEKVMKSFELTATVREIMRAGLREPFPNASEEEIQRLYVDRLLGYQGPSLAEIHRPQAEEDSVSSIRKDGKT